MPAPDAPATPRPRLPFSSWSRRWIGLARVEEEQVFLLLAVVIGIFAGLAVVCFRVAIEFSRIALLGSDLRPGWPTVIVVPTVIGVAVALLSFRIFPRIRGSGVAHTKAAVYVYDGYIPFSTVVGKFTTCSVAIGSGQSLGPEDPSLQIGAGLASAFGRRLRLSRARIRLIAPLGAAAGLAAAFNSPITAVLFVIEEVLGNWSAGVLGAVVLSAASAAVVAQLFLGHDPLFRVPPFALNDPLELLPYAALGVIGGVFGLAFTRTVLPLRARIIRWPARTRYALPPAAGFLVGSIGLFFPEVLGAGYHAIDQAMHDEFGWQLLAALACAKLVATAISFLSGTPGGLFAPTLFMGAMLGGAVGAATREIAPALVGSTGAFALVGMGTLFAAILRAPLTSVFMIVEISGNYSIVIAVLVSNMIAYVIARRLQRGGLFEAIAEQDGLLLPSMEEAREQPVLRVEDAMRGGASVVLAGDMTIADAARWMEKTGERDYLVRIPSGWCALPRERLSHEGQDPARTAMHLKDLPGLEALPSLYPDQSLESALRLLGGRPLLPVVHRADRSRIEGVMALEDVLNAYRKG
jgi:chloride channel protein, CIC family